MFLMVPNIKMKHEKGVGVSHDSQEWGGKGLRRLKMKHEKGGWVCLMVPKSGVGRIWEG